MSHSIFSKLQKRILKRSCREVSRLISDMQERPLGWWDRLALRAHLSLCNTCARYEKQVRFMSEAMGRWKNYSDDA